MPHIRLNLQNRESYPQTFTLFTEQLWQEQKHLFNENTPRFFSGKKNEVFAVTENTDVNYLIGLGKGKFKEKDLQQVAAKFSWSQRENLQISPTLLNADFLDESQTAAFATGLFLGTYGYLPKTTHPFFQNGFELNLKNQKDEDLLKLELKIRALCEGQFACMDWLNKPANFKRVPQVSNFLKAISQKYGMNYRAMNRQECEEAGLGAFLAVNQGSADGGAFTIIEYRGGDKNAKTIGLVGKCVLFDTGGISLKNPENMHYMKSDMGGATAVIGTLIAAAEMRLPVNIIAVLPITDNAVSSSAYLPSDVVTAFNGKTIEVLNTDAEGRMTLADGLAWLCANYQTDALIDIATLTGSAVRMFGDTCGALLSNEGNLIKKLTEAGEITGQRLWNLPLWDVWMDEIRSDVADLKNISMKPIGDCIVAGKFLEQFVDGRPWAHLDIAGVAFGNVQYAKEKAATGYGVQLLLNFIENF